MGYYSSVTLFTHSHHIENGVVIVHSHLFNSESSEKPIKHQHSKNEYVLIHLLSHFLTTVFFIAFVIEAYKTALKIHIIQNNDDGFYNLTYSSSNGLRAPPLKYIN